MKVLSERGSIAMEFLVAFPLLLILFLAILQLSLLWSAKHLIAYAGFVAARTVSIYPGETDRAREYARRALLPLFEMENLLSEPMEMEVIKGDRKVQFLNPGDDYEVLLKFRFRLSVPIVNSIIGKRGFGGYFFTFSEKRRGVVEPCPGWNKGICGREGK